MDKGPESGYRIERYQAQHRRQIVEIMYDSALLGKSLAPAFTAVGFVELLFLRYYTQYEPESLWVAVTPDGGVIGYLLGCQDTRRQQQLFLKHIVPRLLPSFVVHGVPWRRRNWVFLGRWLWGLLLGDFRTAYAGELCRKYPAHLHISVRKPWRRTGVGQALVERFCQQLVEAKVPGVHLHAYGPPPPASSGALQFFSQMGFRDWARRPVQLFYPYHAGPLQRVTMVRRLDLF